MVAKNICYLYLFQSLVVNGMDHEERQLARSINTYETFTPREIEGQNDITSVASLHHSCHAPQDVDLGLDLHENIQEEIAELYDSEVNFLVKACKFTQLKDVSKKHARAVIKENIDHPKIQKIISIMRQQQVNPQDIHVDHDNDEVRSGGIELGIDVKDIHKLSYDLAGLMWKEDRACCGRTISQKTGQKIIANGLTALTVGSLMAYNIFLIVSSYEQPCETVNNYYYNCTSSLG